MSPTLGISALPEAKQKELINIAKGFVCAKLSHSFSQNERRVLSPFFTNLNQRVFFMHSLPPNVMATLSSMFSRIKNQRGIRGVFVDTFLPGVLASRLRVVKESGEENAAQKFIKDNKISSLGDFISYSPEAQRLFKWFLYNTPSQRFIKTLADSQKAKEFLGMYLDDYGHNSIARMGGVLLCFEGVSVLAAKSIESARPGAGYVELSTRFVLIVRKKERLPVYPIELELEALGVERSQIESYASALFRDYYDLQGDNLNGPFPLFLRDKWGLLVEQSGGKLGLGISGETFDVLGNLLPASTLTSVAAAVSGESLPSILKHLILDDTAENLALVELVIQEASKIGADQFIRHYQVTPAEAIGWECLDVEAASGSMPYPASGCWMMPLRDTHWSVANILPNVFAMKGSFRSVQTMEDVAKILFEKGRLSYDKLPREFELVTIPCEGQMSFRSWRDLQRQGISTHRRTLLTPYFGFYHYDKPAPVELRKAFSLARESGVSVYGNFVTKDVPPVLRQYALPMGFLVWFIYSANLRQHEFCNWQRSKSSVNHEVRQVFLSAEKELRRSYKWWELFSRADMTPAYVFARGSATPLP